MSLTLALTQQLISRASVTPLDEGCQAILIERLASLGFQCETIMAGPPGELVTNLWAKRKGRGKPEKTLVFAGHTDVVPTGPVENWDFPPFTPTIRDVFLYGRGAADMKASIAAFVTGIERFLQKFPNPNISLALLITSDEEGPTNLYGTKYVCEVLKERQEKLDFCIVGEPTSLTRLGDTVKNGRRGSMSGKLTITGVQGHIAYPHLAKNPIHLVAPALAEFVGVTWDEGNAFFPPTTFQISNIHGGTGALNVIPGLLVIDLNFRFSTMTTPAALQKRFEDILIRHGLSFEISWNVSGLPFLTEGGVLLDAIGQAIYAITQEKPTINTKGGTSDGRFIAQICPNVIEFGPCNATIHKVNECVSIADLEPLADIYSQTIALLDAQVTQS